MFHLPKRSTASWYRCRFALPTACVCSTVLPSSGKRRGLAAARFRRRSSLSGTLTPLAGFSGSTSSRNKPKATSTELFLTVVVFCFLFNGPEGSAGCARSKPSGEITAGRCMAREAALGPAEAPRGAVSPIGFGRNPSDPQLKSRCETVRCNATTLVHHFVHAGPSLS